MAAPENQIIHATTITQAGRAALIMGASGSGKSGLALQLIALGAGLVADDRTRLIRQDNRLLADAPATIRNKIEARGMGILSIPRTGPAPVALVVTMDSEETDRLPPFRQIELCGVSLPLQRKIPAAYFPAAILAYLTHNRIA